MQLRIREIPLVSLLSPSGYFCALTYDVILVPDSANSSSDTLPDVAAVWELDAKMTGPERKINKLEFTTAGAANVRTAVTRL